MNIGIDLGTFNSAAAVAIGRRKVVIVESKYGESRYGKNFPSFVLFDHNGKKQLVGGPAESNLARNPELVVWGVKRLIGLSYETALKRGELKRFQYHIEEGPGGSILIRIGEECYSPSHILELILREIKEDAENPNVNPILGEKIEKVVISVPAYFDGTRIGPIIDAAKSAGFTTIETIAEPTAASIVYGLKLNRDSKILTFDIGAGTLDITIMLLLNEDGDMISGELCTSGHEALGGIDMDDLLASYIIKKYKLSKVENDPRSLSMLKEEVEKSKIRLSTRDTVPLDLPNQQTVNLTRKEVEDVLKPLLDKCRGPIRVALRQANLNANQIDHVLFVGGPTHMPCVRHTVYDELQKQGARKEVLQEITNWDPNKVNPMECVAIGASLKAAGFSKPEVQIDPNGYGTILGPVPGLPDFFYSIIPANSNYPLPPQVKGIIHNNPDALRVGVPLVKKLPYDEGGHNVYKYHYLGDYDCYIKSTGDYPEIEIAMELNAEKDLITTFTHKQSRESVCFEKLDQLKGNEIILQEIKEPGGFEELPNKDYPTDESFDSNPQARRPDSGPRPTPSRRGWSTDQLNRSVHVAQMLMLDFAEKSQDRKVERKRTELNNLIQNVNHPDDTRFVMRRIQELLNALINAHEISQAEFQNNMDALKEIEKKL